MNSVRKQQHETEVLIDSKPVEFIHVLLIDDDPAYRHLCQRYLKKNHAINYEIVAVSNATAGLSECQSASFDCLLIDYSLPDISGTEVIRSLSDLLAEDAPPTIILTADGGEAAAAEALRAGAADFMPKRTISAQSLSRAIENAVEKKKLKNKVAARSRELQRANDQLQSRNDEIQRFYHTVSHEVKTPLAAAREFIAIVLDGIAGPVTEDQIEMLRHALDSCDQITSHFNDLIEMTRLEAKKITMEKKMESLDNIIIRCLAAISSAVKTKNIVLKKEIKAPLPLMLMDSNRVIQVLSNLLGNALKFTEENGKITLRIWHAIADGYVHIAVADTGRGISQNQLPHIFERLYQVENGSDEFMGAGLGLGLTIAKEIVALHGGNIWAESVLGEGSTFTFRLPVA